MSVLSDDEGYTARVRTSDGKEGYVARMYLFMGKSSANSARLPIRLWLPR